MGPQSGAELVPTMDLREAYPAGAEGPDVMDQMADQQRGTETRSRAYDALLGTSFGQKAIAGIAAVGLMAPAVGALGAETADAADPDNGNSVTMVVRNARANAADVASKKIVFGEDVRIKKDKQNEKRL